MACEVVMPQVEVIDGLYHQTAWTQPLSPEMGSPVYAHSPVGSVCSPASAHSPLSHANSPIGGCCSPIAAAQSPVMQTQSPMHGPPMLCVPIKQEFDDSFHGYESHCSHLTSLLKCTAPDMAGAAFANGCLMGPPAPREILDGTLLCIVTCTEVCTQFYKSDKGRGIFSEVNCFYCSIKQPFKKKSCTKEARDYIRHAHNRSARRPKLVT